MANIKGLDLRRKYSHEHHGYRLAQTRDSHRGLAGDDLNLTPLIKYLKADEVCSPLKKKVHTSISYSQIPDPEFWDCFGEVRPVKPNLLFLRIEGESQA